MSKKIFQKVGTVALVAVMAAPFAANAESNTATSGSATARVDFRITIPRFLSLQVGSLSTVDRIEFNPTLAQILAGTQIGGSGGNAVAGSGVTTIVRANNGQVTLAATTTALVNGAGNTIDWSQIITLSDNLGLPAPQTGSVVAVPVAANLANGRVTNQAANWEYRFQNQAANEGVYNGTVTYTASMP